MATARDKFSRVMRRGDVTEGIPVMEFGPIWDITYESWIQQGLPEGLSGEAFDAYFGLDSRVGEWKSPITQKAKDAANIPADWRVEQPIIGSEREYDRILPHLYPVNISDESLRRADRMAARQSAGEVWIMHAFDGPFWYPRMLLGVEPHFYAFYDQPRFMKRMIESLTEYNLLMLDKICSLYTPDVVVFAEDMCYRSGSMISSDLFEEFMAAHYRALLPEISKRNILSMVDSDGQLEEVIPWFVELGLDGMSPMERRAGVDVNRIRKQYPDFIMSGGFDKTVMHLGEAALRSEFERLKPAVLSGRYVPTEDHQVPPSVSLDDFKLYIRLLQEFSLEVAREARAIAHLE